MSSVSVRSLRKWADRRRRWKRNTEPPPIPAGWATAPPDFVGVGVEKAGTSWWYELLVAHPEVSRPQLARKELRYFNRFGNVDFQERHADGYAALFARPPGKLCGEWTPGYMTDFWVPPLLSRSAPNARLLVILREPVDRFVSGLAQARQSGRSDSLSERRRAFERGCYASQLERLWEWFTPEQTLVLLYEHCRDDPRTQLRRTYEFVGLDPSFVPDDLHRPVHATVREKPDIEERVAGDIRRSYSPEIERLGRLCPDLDLDRWRNRR